MKPSDFPLGSLASRAAARAEIERSEREPAEVISVRIIHIGHDGKQPLPLPQRRSWERRVTEITHAADARR